MVAAKSRLQIAIEVMLQVSYRCMHWLIGAILTATSTFFIPSENPGMAGAIVLISMFFFLIVAGTVLMIELGFPFLKRGIAIAMASDVSLLVACYVLGTLKIIQFGVALFVATLLLFLVSRILYVTLFVGKETPPFRTQLIVDRILRGEYRKWS